MTGTPAPAADRPHRDSGSEAGGHVVFVSDFRYVERSFGTLEPVLLDREAAWLHALALRSGAAGEDARTGSSATVRVGSGGGRARVSVLVTLGAPRGRPGEVLVPLTWEPLQLERLLPSLDGDITLNRVDDSACRFGLAASYRVPLAGLGERLDRFALHRVAESSVRSFLEEGEASFFDVLRAGREDEPAP